MWHRYAIRLMMIIAGLSIWFGTQALLGSRSGTENKVGDGLHEWTAAANEFLHENSYWSTFLLCGSSAIVDFSALLLVIKFIFGSSLRPYLALLILFLTRQVCQALVTLPSPEGMIWYDPGFPSLFVTYYVTNDLFFSGHTGIVVLAAVELFQVNNRMSKLLGVLLVALQISALIVLRAHYTMDIFAGAIMALLTGVIADWIVKNFRIENKNKRKQF